MAPADPLDTEPASLEEPVGSQGLVGVSRTGRHEPAGTRDHRAHRVLVQGDHRPSDQRRRARRPPAGKIPLRHIQARAVPYRYRRVVWPHRVRLPADMPALAWRIHLHRTANGTSPAALEAMITQSKPSGSPTSRTAARIRRFTRLRTTAEPILRPTTNPNRLHPSDRRLATSVIPPRWDRVPERST